RGQGTCREGLAGEFVDALPAVDLQLQDHLAGGGGIRDLLFGGGRELRLVYQQDVDVIADDEGRHGLVCQLVVRGKPSAAKKRADAARSLTGRLTAILVGIGASIVVAGGCCLVKNAVSASASDVACTLCVWPSATRCAARGGLPAGVLAGT